MVLAQLPGVGAWAGPLGSQPDKRDLAWAIEPQGQPSHSQSAIHVHGRIAPFVDAASLIRNHSRGIVVSGEGQGDLAAVGMSRKHEGEAEPFCLLKETRPVGQ